MIVLSNWMCVILFIVYKNIKQTFYVPLKKKNIVLNKIYKKEL